MDKKKVLKKWIYLAFMLVTLLVFVAWFYIKEAQRQNTVLIKEDTKTLAQESDKQGTKEIYVHITGAVNAPGIVKLPPGARLVDAIEQAGGLLESADSDSVNLASLLEDEDKIHIYPKSDGGPNTNSPDRMETAQGKVNINTASLEALQTLPGIGETIGKNIIAYREKNGLFKSLEDLKEVDRIGDKMYEKIKESITL